MEEDKKRKKSKKKKNKQNKSTESSLDGAGERITSGQNHDQESGQKNIGPVHEIKDAQDDVFQGTDVDQLRNVADGREVSTLADTEKKHQWLEREANLKEKIRQFQEEREAQIQKEVVLEEKIQKILKEKDVSLEKEGGLLEQIKQLQSEKASLEHQISQLQKEKEAYAQKESSLAEEIAQLQSEKEAHMQKEVQFEEKINLLLDEATKLSSEKNPNKEKIAALNVDNSRLHAQVLQLEQSRNTLLEENQQLRGSISDQQSQILNFEDNTASYYSSTAGKVQTIENGDMASQMETAHMLVEKLITENAELVEKVNELHAELYRRNLQKEVSYDNGTPGTAESAVADNSVYLLDLKVESDERQQLSSTSGLIPGTGANMSISGEMVQDGRVADKDERNVNLGATTSTTGAFSNSPEVIPGTGANMSISGEMVQNGRVADKDERNVNLGATTSNTGAFSNSPEVINSDEIVQIPLDENERPADPEAGNIAERTEVPISHAPLIGAPFRIISFVTRYVSGADLVERNSVTTR